MIRSRLWLYKAAPLKLAISPLDATAPTASRPNAIKGAGGVADGGTSYILSHLRGGHLPRTSPTDPAPPSPDRGPLGGSHLLADRQPGERKLRCVRVPSEAASMAC